MNLEGYNDMSGFLSGCAKKILFFVFLSLLFVAGKGGEVWAAGRAAEMKAETGSWQVQDIRTPRGLTLWLVEDQKLPLIAMSFSFRGGVEHDPADRQGLSMLAAGLLDQGAGKLKAEAFQEALAQDSIYLGFFAGRDQVGGQLKTRVVTQDKAFALLRSALLHPRFDEEALRLAQDQQKARIRQLLSDPEWQARFALFRSLFAGHPYAQRAAGTVASVEAITRADVQHWHQRHLARRGLVIAMAGAIKARQAAEIVDRVFGDLPLEPDLKDLPDVTIPPVVGPDGEGAGAEAGLLVRRAGTQTDMVFAAFAPKRQDEDWYPLEIANYILGGGGFSSRLMKELRTKEGLTYGVSTSLASMDHASLILGQVAADNDKIARARQKMMEVLRDFYENGPTIQEIDAAKAFLSGSLPLALTSTDKIASFLVGLQREGLNKDYLAQYKAFLAKVSPDDVRRAIRKYLAPATVFAAFAGAPENLRFDPTQIFQQTEE